MTTNPSQKFRGKFQFHSWVSRNWLAAKALESLPPNRCFLFGQIISTYISDGEPWTLLGDAVDTKVHLSTSNSVTIERDWRCYTCNKDTTTSEPTQQPDSTLTNSTHEATLSMNSSFVKTITTGTNSTTTPVVLNALSTNEIIGTTVSSGVQPEDFLRSRGILTIVLPTAGAVLVVVTLLVIIKVVRCRKMKSKASPRIDLPVDAGFDLDVAPEAIPRIGDYETMYEDVSLDTDVSHRVDSVYIHPHVTTDDHIYTKSCETNYVNYAEGDEYENPE